MVQNNIAVIRGDGIGIEVVEEGIKVLEAVSENYDLLLKNGKVVLPEGIKQINVGVTKGKIQAITENSNISADEVFDCKGLHVLPGVIDSQVHFREPGNEHKETLETGMKSAAMGGVTAVFEMPNTNPLTIPMQP